MRIIVDCETGDELLDRAGRTGNEEYDHSIVAATPTSRYCAHDVVVPGALDGRESFRRPGP